MRANNAVWGCVSLPAYDRGVSGTFLGGSVSTGDMLDRSLWTEVTAASATKHTTTKLHIHVYCDVLRYTKHVTEKILYLLLMQQYWNLLKCLSDLIICKICICCAWFLIYPILEFIFSIWHREYQWKLTNIYVVVLICTNS